MTTNRERMMQDAKELGKLREEVAELRAFKERMRELSQKSAPLHFTRDAESGWDYVTGHIEDELGE